MVGYNMKYTRKEIIKTAAMGGIAFLIPSIMHFVNKYETNKLNTFMTSLEENKKALSNDMINIDILLMNTDSAEEFDFVLLAYNKVLFEAPIVAIYKNEEYRPKNFLNFKADIKTLNQFSQKYKIQIFEGSKELIKKIKACKNNPVITEDLYKPVSILYAAKYMTEKKTYNNYLG